MKIIGIDLGTSNTYLYGSDGAQNSFSMGEPPAPVLVPRLGDDSGSIATVVLYEDGVPILAGNIAENEFYANSGAQSRRRLASQFKPEISQGTHEAMRAMEDFLLLLREALPQGTLEADSRVYVGIPSLAKEDFSLNMAACFAAAGWPRPAFVRESDAALISCLQSGTLDIDDLERRCLIVDFGGGTCDFTSVEGLEVLQNGGDMLYGGRLFDDLVYQVFQKGAPEAAARLSASPYEWYVHWIECKEEKEKFSTFLGSPATKKAEDTGSPGMTLHVSWLDQSGKSEDIFIRDYNLDSFTHDAENYAATPQMLRILADYAQKGGISRQARDLLDKKQVGLLSWFRDILENTGGRREFARIVLTGGSSRWPFVGGMVSRLFPAASVVPSKRSYEDIAFGLALFPMLEASHARVNMLLKEKIAAFSQKAAATAKKLMQKNAAQIISLCSQRIVDRDIMPVLDAAQQTGATVAGLEESFSRNIRNDAGLSAIAEEKCKSLQKEIQDELNFSFRAWLKENGVLLTPNFTFPVQAIGQEFFNNISVKISRLDSLKLMNFTLTTIVPVIAATTTATTIAHTGEPVSSLVGGGLAFGATWLMAKTAPKLLEKRKLPAFLLNESNRKKIVEKNRAYIEKSLRKAFADTQENLEYEIERRLKNSMVSMLARLTVFNQIKTH